MPSTQYSGRSLVGVFLQFPRKTRRAAVGRHPLVAQFRGHGGLGLGGDLGQHQGEFGRIVQHNGARLDLRLLPFGQFGHGVAVVQLAVLVHIVAGDDVLKAFGVVLGDSALHHFPALRHMLGNPPGGVEITR